MVGWQRILEYASAAGVPRRSLLAAAVVGTIPNLINQGGALFADRRIDRLKVVLTYVRTVLRHHLRRRGVDAALLEVFFNRDCDALVTYCNGLLTAER